MAKWVRNQEMPETQRFSMNVTNRTHPNLANWLWNLPFGTGAAAIKDALEVLASQRLATPDHKQPQALQRKKTSEDVLQPLVASPTPNAPINWQSKSASPGSVETPPDAEKKPLFDPIALAQMRAMMHQIE